MSSAMESHAVGLRQTLRLATRADHQLIDGLGSRFDLGSAEGYAAFLSAQASVVVGLETLIDDHGPRPPQWPNRRRSGALAADLAALGRAMPAIAVIPALPSSAHRAGALYVLEGSRLGGRILAKGVANALPDAPAAFLSHRSDAPSWTEFVHWLDGLDLDEAGRGHAVEGAKRTFGAFADAFQR